MNVLVRRIFHRYKQIVLVVKKELQKRQKLICKEKLDFSIVCLLILRNCYFEKDS